MISFGYAGMNLAALYWIMEPWGGRLAFAGLSFIMAIVLVSIRDNMNIVSTLMSRIGVAIGISIWIFYLYESVKKELPRKQPDYFFIADMRNHWH